MTPRTEADQRAEDRARKELRQGKNARAGASGGGIIRSEVGGVEVVHRGACVYVGVRDSSDARRAFERFCRHHSLVRECVYDGEESTAPDGSPVSPVDVWKVVGDPAALMVLAEPNHTGRLWWVASAELGGTARVGGQASGSGELSEGAKRRMRLYSALRLKETETPPKEGEMVKRERAQAFIERQRKRNAHKA